MSQYNIGLYFKINTQIPKERSRQICSAECTKKGHGSAKFCSECGEAVTLQMYDDGMKYLGDLEGVITDEEYIIACNWENPNGYFHVNIKVDGITDFSSENGELVYCPLGSESSTNLEAEQIVIAMKDQEFKEAYDQIMAHFGDEATLHYGLYTTQY